MNINEQQQQHEQISNEKDSVQEMSLCYDKLIENKVKFGKVQLQVLFVVALYIWLNAAQLILIGFQKPILGNQWGINDTQQALLGSSIFLGWALGSFISAITCDKYGRYILLMIYMYGVTITSFVIAFSQNIIQILIYKFCIGFFIGIGLACYSSIVNEISPIHIRARSYVFVGASSPIGQIFIIGIAYIYMDSLETGNWKIMCLYTALFCLVILIFSIFYLIESPRFLLLAGRFEEGVKLLKQMSIKNNKANQINEQDIKMLKEWVEYQQNEIIIKLNQEKNNPLQMIFSQKILFTTILLMVIWLSQCFIYYGIMFELPTILSQMSNQQKQQVTTKNEQFVALILNSIVEIPGGILTFYLIETSYGRKQLLIMANIVTIIVCCLIIYLEGSYLIELISIIRFTSAGQFLTVYQYTAEIYPTQFRGAGISFQNMMCRIVSIFLLMQNSQMLETYGVISIFYLCLIVAVLSLISALLMKKDTKDAGLDDYFIEDHQQASYEQLNQNENEKENENDNSTQLQTKHILNDDLIQYENK